MSNQYFESNFDDCCSSLELADDSYDNSMMFAYHMRNVFTTMERIEYMVECADGTESNEFTFPSTYDMKRKRDHLRERIAKTIKEQYND